MLRTVPLSNRAAFSTRYLAQWKLKGRTLRVPPPKKIKDPELPFTFNWVAFPISQNSEVVFKANLEMQKIWIFLLKKPSFFLSISTFTQVIQQKKTTICYMTGNPYVIVHHLKILLQLGDAFNLLKGHSDKHSQIPDYMHISNSHAFRCNTIWIFYVEIILQKNTKKNHA